MSSPPCAVHCTTLTPDNLYISHCSSQSSNIHPSYMSGPSYPVHCTTLTPDNLYKSHCSSHSSNIHPSYMSSPSCAVHCTTLIPDTLYISHCSSQSSNIHPSYMSSPSYPAHYNTLTPHNLYKSVPQLVKKFHAFYGIRSLKIRVFCDTTFCRWASTSWSSETSGTAHLTTRRHIPEDLNFRNTEVRTWNIARYVTVLTKTYHMLPSWAT